jgi:hypothetical protein
MKDKSLWSVFWVLVAVFVISICNIFVLPFTGTEMRYIFFTTWAILFGLGVALITLTVKKRITGLPKKLFLVTGSSAAGIPFFAVLHNLVTALCIEFFHFNNDFDEPVFFIIAVIVCPLGFLAGAIGTIVLAIRNRTNAIAGIP